jgi:CxC4 like cysteine cluster associated with KDZ transposases
MCHRRFIGPECGDIGLFNFNNRVLMTHNLLDDYTSCFTSSETPFTAWVAVTARRYESEHSDHKFVSEPMLRAAWFSYVKLQYLDGDMECPDCGPSPENIIWDGVTLAFHRKHLLPTLCPPTTICDDSVIREKTRYVYNQQLLPEKGLRKLVREIITGPPLLPVESGKGMVEAQVTHKRQDNSGGGEEGDAGDGSDEEIGDGISAKSKRTDAGAKARKELLARIEAIPDACERLSNVNAGLGEVFSHHFGLLAIVQRRWGLRSYVQLFSQVRSI